MVPSMMEELLFDDILFGDGAREEFGRLRRVLQLLGVEVTDAADLLEEALASDEARRWVFDVVLSGVPAPARQELCAHSPAELAAILVGGQRRALDQRGREVEDLYVLPPLPNWCFQRDPQIVLGDAVVFCSMATAGASSRGVARAHDLHVPSHARGHAGGVRSARGPRRAARPRGGAPSKAATCSCCRPTSSPSVGPSARIDRASTPWPARSPRARTGATLAVRGRDPAPARVHAPGYAAHADRSRRLPGPCSGAAPRRARAGASVRGRSPRRRSAAAADGVALRADGAPRADPRARALRRRRLRGPAARAVDRRCERAGARPRRDPAVRPQRGAPSRSWRAAGSASSRPRTCCSVVRRSTSTTAAACASSLSSHEMSRARGGPHCLVHPLEREP